MNVNVHLVVRSNFGVLEVMVPGGWRVEQEGTQLELTPPDGDFGINTSVIRHKDPDHVADAREHVERWLTQRAPLAGVNVEPGNRRCAAASYADAEGFRWRVRMLCERNVLLLSTLNGRVETEADEQAWQQARRVLDTVLLNLAGAP